MKNYKSVRSSCRLNVTSGEMVCVMDANRNNYSLYLNDTLLTHTTVIALHQAPVGTEDLPLEADHTVAEILEQWSHRMSACDPEKVASLFGLEDVLDVPFAHLDKTDYYRLQLLKAILEDAPAIEFVAPWRITDFSCLLHGAYTLSCQRSDFTQGVCPAFIAYDPGYLPGLAFVADRVLGRSENTLVELLTDF